MRQIITLILVLVLLALPVRLAAQEHVVLDEELRDVLVKASEERRSNIRSVRSLFESDMARAALEVADIELDEVQDAVAALGDEELSRLAARAAQVQTEIVAGALTNQQITYILIALGAAVIVIVLS